MACERAKMVLFVEIPISPTFDAYEEPANYAQGIDGEFNVVGEEFPFAFGNGEAERVGEEDQHRDGGEDVGIAYVKKMRNTFYGTKS